MPPHMEYTYPPFHSFHCRLKSAQGSRRASDYGRVAGWRGRIKDGTSSLVEVGHGGWPEGEEHAVPCSWAVSVSVWLWKRADRILQRREGWNTRGCGGRREIIEIVSPA